MSVFDGLEIEVARYDLWVDDPTTGLEDDGWLEIYINESFVIPSVEGFQEFWAENAQYPKEGSPYNYNNIWFESNPNRNAVRTVPGYYYQLLLGHGREGVNETLNPFFLNIGYNAFYGEHCNAMSYSDMGPINLNRHMALPDIIAHEMTHVILHTKSWGLGSSSGIDGIIHEGMSDVMGELIEGVGWPVDWISADTVAPGSPCCTGPGPPGER